MELCDHALHRPRRPGRGPGAVALGARHGLRRRAGDALLRRLWARDARFRPAGPGAGAQGTDGAAARRSVRRSHPDHARRAAHSVRRRDVRRRLRQPGVRARQVPRSDAGRGRPGPQAWRHADRALPPGHLSGGGPLAHPVRPLAAAGRWPAPLFHRDAGAQDRPTVPRDDPASISSGMGRSPRRLHLLPFHERDSRPARPLFRDHVDRRVAVHPGQVRPDRRWRVGADSARRHECSAGCVVGCSTDW